MKGFGMLAVPSLIDMEDMLPDTGAVVQQVCSCSHKSNWMCTL